MRILSLILSSPACLGLACSTAIVVQDTEGTASEASSDSANSSTGGASASASDSASSTATDSGSGTGTTGGTGTGDVTGTTGAESTGQTTDATSTASGSDSDSTTTDATGTTGDTTGGTDTTTDTTGDTTGTTGDTTTTGGNECFGLPEKQCDMADGCMTVFGKKVNLDKQCTMASKYLGCLPEGACGDAITYACPMDVDPPEPYEFLDTCIPDDFEMCDAPEIKGDCN